jgi:hypothetical protein
MRLRVAMDTNELAIRLDHLKSEHRALDAALATIIAHGGEDQVQMARLKKRKLRVKDDMVRIETLLIPDIIA